MRRERTSAAPPRRDEAIDVARSIAILGMFVIHAVLVLAAAYPRSGPMAMVLWLCDGRAAATFVTLAGFGVARLASKTPAAIVGGTLRRRALILWGMGQLNLIIWPGDILRVYGVALLVSPRDTMAQLFSRGQRDRRMGPAQCFIAATARGRWHGCNAHRTRHLRVA